MKYHLYLKEISADYGLTKDEAKDALDALADDETLYPLDIEEENGQSHAVGFITDSAYADINYDPNVIKDIATKILFNTDSTNGDSFEVMCGNYAGLLCRDEKHVSSPPIPLNRLSSEELLDIMLTEYSSAIYNSASEIDKDMGKEMLWIDLPYNRSLEIMERNDNYVNNGENKSEKEHCTWTWRIHCSPTEFVNRDFPEGTNGILGYRVENDNDEQTIANNIRWAVHTALTAFGS